MSQVSSPGFVKLDPCTGELLQSYVLPTEFEIREAVRLARQAQNLWAKTSLRQRSQVLKGIRQHISQNAHKLAQTISRETGKPLSDSLEADVATALNVLSYYAEIGPRQLSPRLIAPEWMSLAMGRLHRETWRPRGVVAVISPWNFPVGISCSGIAAAVMAGNAVILKPSELAPACGQHLVALVQQALSQAGYDASLVQVLVGDGSTGACLLAQSVDGVVFTGSEATGRRIAEDAARRGIWCSQELGGSDAMIVLDGCDLEQVASYAVWGRFINAGQTCAAVKRLLVPASQEAELLGHLAEKIGKLKVGPPTDIEVHMGPLISEAQRQLIDGQVQEALSRGARLWVGGKSIAGPGFFYEPTLLSGVPADARVLTEETFGPVLPVIPYATTDEAIQLANESAFGLTASVFGPPRQAHQVASQLHCGTVVVNDVGPTNYALACAPWGGWKASGTGFSHGAACLNDLSRRVVVTENLLFALPFATKPIWHFCKGGLSPASRTRTVLALATRNLWLLLNPKLWWPFWQHRPSTRL